MPHASLIEDRSQVLLAGLARRDHHYSGFLAEKAAFHLIDQLAVQVAKLETWLSRARGRRLEVAK
ncbi:MAG: hypothetical protein ACYDD1_14865 [Caulobacteraceae bacterium]